jgi:hypothetical protein
MIKNAEAVRKLEIDLIRKDRADHFKKMSIVDAMLAEATAFGVFPPSHPLAGIEVDIRVAKAVNSVRRTP